MYTTKNFPTKKALKEALAAGEEITVYQPNGDITGITAQRDGPIALEGPHYPKPHTWYAMGTMKDGRLVAVK